MQTTHTTHAHGAHDVHEHHPRFLTKYVFSTDHKMIGIQYGVTALCFLLFGFCLMMLMRWQMAYPGQAIPVIGPLLLASIRQSVYHRSLALSTRHLDIQYAPLGERTGVIGAGVLALQEAMRTPVARMPVRDAGDSQRPGFASGLRA